MSLIETPQQGPYNPLSVVEGLATDRDWSFDRSDENEITILSDGRQTDYQVAVTWMDDIEALHLACAFDLKVPSHRDQEVMKLILMINERMWVGHFDLWRQDGLVMYRHGHPLTGGVEISPLQCEALIQGAIEACERYYSAFQYVIWAGKKGEEALESSDFETAGEA